MNQVSMLNNFIDKQFFPVFNCNMLLTCRSPERQTSPDFENYLNLIFFTKMQICAKL